MRTSVRWLLAAALLAAAPGCLWPFRKRDPNDPAGSPRIQDPDKRFAKPSINELEAEQAKPNNGLALRIRANKTDFEPGERIVVDLMLVNVTGGRSTEKARDIPVYFEVFAKDPKGNPAFWLVKFEIRCETTGRLHFVSGGDVQVPEDKRADYYHFLTLPPKAYVGRSFPFPGHLLALEPGHQYSIAAAYIVSEDYPFVIRNRDFTPEQVEMLGIDLAYARIWTGRLHSNRVRFRIKKRRRFLGLF